MTITCQTHGETEAYDDRGDCRKCAREYASAHRVKNKRKRENERLYVPVATHSSWLTCNTCGLVCADTHTLFTHKRGQHPVTTGTPEPEPKSLLQSTLRPG